ncbi:unnamed protein product [Prorocentrum cordatum]|uniref:Uncharacterized protein n=1 Tax=Prorocentrum cordatum TaxID=2364126 RepID=A0ABN9QTM4_9DINO|nr:unnamed protein product [Polarella glacialis]
MEVRPPLVELPQIVAQLLVIQTRVMEPLPIFGSQTDVAMIVVLALMQIVMGLLTSVVFPEQPPAEVGPIVSELPFPMEMVVESVFYLLEPQNDVDMLFVLMMPQIVVKWEMMLGGIALKLVLRGPEVSLLPPTVGRVAEMLRWMSASAADASAAATAYCRACRPVRLQRSLESKTSQSVTHMVHGSTVLSGDWAAAAAAQRSVVVQAAEIREGLRQWGLARAACARVNAARGELAEAKRSSADRDAQARAECRALLEERQERQRDVAALAADVEARRRQHGRLVERRRAVEDHLEELRTSRVSASRQSEEALRRKAQVSVESAQAGEELESALLALREHEVDRGMAELLQTQRQLISFRQAHAALREALKTTTQQLEWEREYEQSLKADHEMTNLSLEALASGYLEALHEIAGVEQ